jgi:hypothetical protein
MPIKESQPYITLSFDNIAEPTLELDTNKLTNSKISLNKFSDYMDTFPRHIRALSRVGVDSLNHQCKLEGVDGYKIIRPTHRASNRYTFELYSKQNIYVSEHPNGYLNIYKNTSLNFTDRVHSALASLVWGNPTQLMTKSKRSHLFERVGLSDIMEKPVVADLDYIEGEKDSMLNQLKSIL